MLSVIAILLLNSYTVLAFYPSTVPNYCNNNFTDRKIPPLSASEKSLVSELIQVQAIIRHGARTPYTAYQCWADYDIPWNNCNVTELMIESNSYTSQQRPAKWLFRKLYDGSANDLGGNCYTGQLLYEGFEQELQNGRYMYDAYIDSDLPLFNTDIWTDINTNQQIYLRSDDEQRTLMSGQLLLHGMFNVSQEIIVPWHTGDYNLDQIYPNSYACPRLSQLENQIYATSDFIAENTSTRINTLNTDLNVILGTGQWYWYYIFDCFMTTVCTNRQVPSGSANTVLMTDEIFNATIAQVEYQQSYLYLYNNSQYAKLAMGNTAWHVRTNIQNMLNAVNAGTPSSALKFALFSAHDTTVMPFLAAIQGNLWDRIWAPYASMVTIEIYKASNPSSTPSGYYFRLTYNSKAIKIPSCSDYLCDLNNLLTALSFGEEKMPCSTTTTSSSSSGSSCSDDSSLSDSSWAIVVVFTALFGVLVGAAIVIFVNKWSFQEQSGKKEESGTIMSPLA